MPKETEEQITLTPDELKKIIAEAVKTQAQPDTTSMFKELVQAVIESRKPYVAPGQEENEKMLRQANREQQQAIIRNKRAAQDNCPHTVGLAGQKPGDDSSFWIHKLDTGETIGICSFCQKVISSLVPEDQRFFALKGSNAPSSAGQRQFLYPITAMTARFPDEEKKAIKERLLGLTQR